MSTASASRPHRSRNALRWAWGVALVAATGVALVLTFVLALVARGGGFYERHFGWLFWANAAIGALLLAVVGLAVVRLALRLRRGKFGSRLLIKLAGIFALVGLLPGMVIYTVSYQFVTRSIEAWFDERVASALDAGLGLGRSVLDTLAADVEAKTRLAAERLGDPRSVLAALTLERLREQLGASEVAIVADSGQVLVTAGGDAAIIPERPAALLLRQARADGSGAQVEGLGDDDGSARPLAARVRALARLPSTDLDLRGDERRYLLATVPIAPALAADALAVQAAYSEYQQRALARDGLRRAYIGTLTLALVLSVFGAVLLAIVLGNQLARPLLLLADGVRQVAAGDLRAKPVFGSRDELGGLTRSFADMTQQLADARAQVQRGVAQLEGARMRLQTILDNLTAGVIVLDREGRIDTANPGATRILRLPLASWRGQRLDGRPELQALAGTVAQRFEQLATHPEPGERDHWQEAFELAREARAGAPREVQTLLLRGAALPPDARLLVFDDITEVVSAQRAQAWAEVARRLAHEIRNPLTPIQLSAERLRHKLHDKLAGNEAALLERSVATIVAQVQAMQQLVTEFRDYARLPAAQLQPVDLAALAAEVLVLYGDAQDRGQLSARLTEGLPAILGDATQLRQVVHNLLRNALEAVADRDDGAVRLAVAPVQADDGSVRAVRLTVRDNGPGFAPHVLQRAFEPYVTTKPRGTGLGLAVVRKIADEHHAELSIGNVRLGDAPDAPVAGARVSLSFSQLATADATRP
ncbi:MAG: HAMP domain-containing protein [Rhodoferax sp.]|nr:HAMP domain-containing protein [Rhodoferax sp.]MCL4736872.1 HAMP domain-containing protein [Burkholderiaceae bacterium]MCP5289530.1 HAMP domain-containing protein [Burkholderiaceae bacterium]